MGLTLPISRGKDGPTDHVNFLPSSPLQCAVPVGIQHAHSSSYYFYNSDRSKASVLDPREGKRDTAATAREESDVHAPTRDEGLAPVSPLSQAFQPELQTFITAR